MSPYFQTHASKNFYDDFIYFRLLACGSRQFQIAFGLITFPFEITLTYTEEGVHSVTNYSLIGDGLWQMYQVNFVFLLWMNTKYYSNNSAAPTSLEFKIEIDMKFSQKLRINATHYTYLDATMLLCGNVIKKYICGLLLEHTLKVLLKYIYLHEGQIILSPITSAFFNMSFALKLHRYLWF